ncbi:MAG: AIR synthase related protein [Ignavibacteriaceae bacterium]|nr:AIR synthase related protein [Ignavibacteriaceae bacterium]
MIADILLEKYSRMKNHDLSDAFTIRQVRDLLITELTNDFWMVVASDSAGGIGPKKNDTVYAPHYDLGRLVIRVPVMEILSSGAVPILVVDTLSVEMEPSGKEIIRGVRDEVSEAGMNSNLVVTGSTEDNVITTQTGMGAVIIGIIDRKDFRPGKSLKRDIVVCVGIPKSAPEFEIKYSDPEIADPKTIRQLNRLAFVHDILPVGSKGIAHEFNELAASSCLKRHFYDDIKVNIDKSGGPSTCCLVSFAPEYLEVFKEKINKPISVIGEMRE